MPQSAQQGFTLLERTDQLDSLIASSHSRPVLILKHSPMCGTSFEALDDLEEHLDRLAGIDLHLIDVIRHRTLSQTIATRFKVRHESPQALLLIDGQVRWSGSHYSVTADRIARAAAASRAAV